MSGYYPKIADVLATQRLPRACECRMAAFLSLVFLTQPQTPFVPNGSSELCISTYRPVAAGPINLRAS
jgi:hypothetical protein